MPFTVKRFKDYVYNELNRESRTRHMNDRALQFEDAEGRKIKISPDEGVQVEDSEGTIIHDTPDCIIAADMAYGGHVYFKTAPDYFGSISASGVSAGGLFTQYTSLANADMSTYLPTDVTNANAALVFCLTYFSLDDQMIDYNTVVECRTHYSMAYNTSANTTYSYIGNIYARSQSASGDTEDFRYQVGSQAIVPLVYNGTTPYITWYGYLDVISPTSATGRNWNSIHRLYLQGFLV